MKQTARLFLIIFSLYTGACLGQELDDTTTSALDPNIDLYHLPETSDTKSLMKEARIAVGTIVKSHHFDKLDYHDYNDSHRGVYININRWSLGTFTNSSDDQSVFITYNTNLYQNNLFTVNLVTGAASGYEDWEYAQGDYLPILGVSAQWSFLKVMLSYDVVTFGMELPLN